MRKLSAVLFGLLIALGSLVVTSSPAHATSELEQSAEITADCGEVALTFVNNHTHYKDFTYVWNIQTSDGQNYNVFVAQSDSPVTEVVTLDPAENGGFGWVSYGVVAGPESDYYLVNQTAVVALCEPDPVSPSPSMSASPSPSASVSPSPSESPSSTPSASPSPSEVTPQPSPSESTATKPAATGLPMTGSSLPWLLAVAAVLIGLGTGLRFLGRRRGSPAAS